MRKVYAFVFGIGFLFSNAQTKVDSLVRALPKTTSDTTRINLLNQISALQTNTELKHTYAIKASALAIKIKWNKGIAEAVYSKAMAFYSENNYQKAAAFFKDAGEKYTALGNTKQSTRSTINLGSCYLSLGQYPKAVESYLYAVKMAEEHQLPFMQSVAYEGIATVFSRESNLDKAIAYALKALQINREMKDNLRIASVSHLLGVSYHLKDDVKNAARYYTESLKSYTAINDSIGMATNYSHLGLIEKESDFNSGLQFQLKANAIFEGIDPNFYNAIQNLGNLGKSYFEIYSSDSLANVMKINKKVALDKAFDCLSTTLKRSRATDDPQNTVENLSVFAEVQMAIGNSNGAFASMKEYQKLHDSLFSQDNKNKIATLESAQQLELKDKQIQLNQLTIDAKEKQKWYLFAGIAALIIIVSLLFIQSRNRQKTNAKLNRLNAELHEANNIKTRFFSILNHDLRGPAASVVNFLRLQQQTPELLDAAKLEGYQNETIHAAEYLLDTMEDLLLWCKGQMENFKPVPEPIEVHTLFENLSKHFEKAENIAFSFSNPQDMVVYTDEDYLMTIMRNLTGNAMKSIGVNADAAIEWKAWDENGQHFLSITDTGSGATAEKFKALYDDSVVSGTRSGLGLHLIRDLAKAINCTVQFQTDLGKGTTFTLSLGKM